MARQSKVLNPKHLAVTPKAIEKMTVSDMIRRWAAATEQERPAAERELVVQGFARKVAIAKAARNGGQPNGRASKKSAKRSSRKASRKAV